MSKYYYAIFALILIIKKIDSAHEQRLNVDILYESLCPDSLEFITQQLHPVWKELSPYVNLKLVPFGKSASLENGRKFICQHGSQECKGNRIQSCAFSVISDQDAQVDYANCFMKTFRKSFHNGDEHGQTCADPIGLDSNKISQCYDSSHATQLQLLAEQDTLRISPKFIPTILYNGVFDQQLQDDSLKDFRRVVCTLITQNYPEACKSPSIIRL